jgi:predicted nucleic acid-binding protein
MYLVDTNIWLEVLLEQERKVESYSFLKNTESSLLYITDFSLYSIGIILIRLEKSDVLEKFVSDAIIESGINVIRLKPEDMKQIIKIGKEFSLDFDDSYQYAAAEQFGLSIVSLDSDFDKTEKGRTALIELLEEEQSFDSDNSIRID